MVVHFTNGFEEGIAGNPLATPPWTLVFGVTQYQNTVVKSGLLGGGIPAVVGGGNEARKTIAVGSTVDNYYMLWYQLDAVPAVGKEIQFAYIRNTFDGNNGLYIRVINVAGTIKWKIRYYTNGSVWAEATSNMSLPAINTWYRIKLFMHRDAVAGEYKTFVNGTELVDISQAGLNLGLTNLNWIGLHADYLYSGIVGQNCFFDDVLWQDVDEVFPVGGIPHIDKRLWRTF